MTSLIFRSLDVQVIQGRADDIAYDDESTRLTYAELLARTAAFAGGLVQVGARDGSRIAIGVQGLHEVVAVLACARIGARPDAKATFRIAGDPPIVHTGEHDYDWATVMSAGRLDPLAAPADDPHGFAEALKDEYEDIFATLTAGGTIT